MCGIRSLMFFVVICIIFCQKAQTLSLCHSHLHVKCAATVYQPRKDPLPVVAPLTSLKPWMNELRAWYFTPTSIVMLSAFLRNWNNKFFWSVCCTANLIIMFKEGGFPLFLHRLIQTVGRISSVPWMSTANFMDLPVLQLHSKSSQHNQNEIKSLNITILIIYKDVFNYIWRYIKRVATVYLTVFLYNYTCLPAIKIRVYCASPQNIQCVF